MNRKTVASIAVSTQSAEWWHWARSLWSVRFHFELHYLSDHSLLQNHVCPLSLTPPLIQGCPFNCCCWYDRLHTTAIFWDHYLPTAQVRKTLSTLNLIFNTSQTEDCSKIDRSDPSFKTTIDDTEDLLSYLQFIELFLPLIVTCIVSIIKIGKY